MSPNRGTRRPRQPSESPQPPEPPRPPPIDRRIELGPPAIAGLVLLAGLIILTATGVLGDSGATRDAIWRVTFVYVFLMLAFRLTGKREVGQMSPFELVTLLMIPEIYSQVLNRNSSSILESTVTVATLFLLVLFSGLLTFRSKKVESVLDGEPTILVRDGKMLDRNLRRERVTPDEVFTEMHLAGIERIEDVKWAILETEGRIAIIAKRPEDLITGRHAG